MWRGQARADGIGDVILSKVNQVQDHVLQQLAVIADMHAGLRDFQASESVHRCFATCLLDQYREFSP